MNQFLWASNIRFLRVKYYLAKENEHETIAQITNHKGKSIKKHRPNINWKQST